MDQSLEQSLEQCTICFNSITEENRCTTECNHIFCKKCIDLWFDQGKNSCPLCRKKIDYFIHNSQNIRIILKSTISQPRNELNNTNEIYNLRVRPYNSCITILLFIQSYFLVKYIYLSSSLYYDLDSCIYNNTDTYNILTECRHNLDVTTTLGSLDVYDHNKNQLFSCYFPLYFINKCFD